MAEIDHWHPVLSSRDLRKSPVAVRLCGEELAVYRMADGKVAALGDACPHRRMRLSLGRVTGDKITCAYHGWTFAKDGQGESPGSPKLHACAKAYDACEQHGYVWARRAGSASPFPEFDIEGWTRVGAADFPAEAPLELTVDNFCEIEHTPEVHLVFGYDKNRMPEVELLPACAHYGIGVASYSPVARGVLAGRHPGPVASGRALRRQRYLHRRRSP